MTKSRFEGTSSYVATDDLTMAVNAAVTLERPILVKGEPGTGKTQLAIEVAGFVAGGPAQTASTKSTYIIRKADNGSSRKLKVRLDKIIEQKFEEAVISESVTYAKVLRETSMILDYNY